MLRGQRAPHTSVEAHPVRPERNPIAGSEHESATDADLADVTAAEKESWRCTDVAQRADAALTLNEHPTEPRVAKPPVSVALTGQSLT